MLRAWFMPALARRLPTAQMSSVYIHQSPYVHWPTTGAQAGRCEVGDLLLAVRPDAKSKPSEGFALLIQTKMSATGNVASPEAIQYALYTQWPEFVVEGANGLTCDLQKSKFVSGPGRRFGDYGLILRQYASTSSQKKWKDRKPWSIIAPTKPLNALGGLPLAELLVSMLEGKAGVPFDATPDPWSRLVNHLLAETFSKALNLATLFPLPHPHVRGATAFLLNSRHVSSSGFPLIFNLPGQCSYSNGYEGYAPTFPKAEGSHAYSGGISTILIDFQKEGSG